MTQNPMEPESGELAAGQSLADLLAKPAFTLTKAALADMLFERVGLNKREAKDMVETFFEEISAALIRGESSRGSATSSCATSSSVRVATPRRARRSPSRRVGSSPSTLPRS